MLARIETLFNPENAAYEKLLSDALNDLDAGDKLTEGKDLQQLRKEIHFQTEIMGESIGGTICSSIVDRIEQLQAKAV